jgi:hypothetical protein
MVLERCVECGRQVSTEASACPGCGRHQPARRPATAYEWTPARIGLLVAAMVSAALFVFFSSREQIRSDRAPTTTAPVTTPSASNTGGYQSLVANVWVGKPLYLKPDLTYIGEILDVADDHRFDDGTTRQAILVRFAAGSTDWVPRNTAQRIYVTK